MGNPAAADDAGGGSAVMGARGMAVPAPEAGWAAADRRYCIFC